MSQSTYSRRNSYRDFPDTSDDSTSKDNSIMSQRLGTTKDLDDLRDLSTKATANVQELFDHFGHQQQGMRSPSPRHFEMAGSAGTKLAQEIHDEFLVCKICLDAYKNPKCLNCLHTFCEQCIENHVMSESTYKKYSDYREFTCPLCRKRTQLPIGGCKKLPDNFLVSSLTEVVVRQRPSKFPFCDICKLVNHKHREAGSKCLDCCKLLCKSCVDLHRDTKVTSNHSIFDVEIEKDIECKEHQDEVVRFYCEPCETCICVLCTFNEHKDHEITQFGEAVTKYKDNISDMLDSCKGKIEKFDMQIDALNKVEEIIKGAEQMIHDSAIKFISDIRTREKQLIEELHNLYGKDMMETIENRKEMGLTVEGLRSTCNLTEVILKGKDIELLLLKKDVQKKLGSLGEIVIKSLPSTINKHVNFLAGSLDLGALEDMDRPLISKMRHKKIMPSGESIHQDITIVYTNHWVQTDLSHKDIHLKAEETDETDTEDEDDDEDEEDEEESDHEEKVKKEFTETGVQTEKREESESESESEEEEEEKPEMIDESTETEEISTEDKGVNTRSRSLQSMAQMRRSPPKEAANNEDTSLAARRRRRRERAATTHFGSYSVDTPDSPDLVKDDYNRKPRSRFLNNHSNSVDNDEVYYDADSIRTGYY